MKNKKKVVGYVSFLFVFFFLFYGCRGKNHEHNHNSEAGGYSMEKETTLPGMNYGICPVMHEMAVKEYSYTYEGKTYYFCCPKCVKEFKKNPLKYISKIKEIDLEAFQFGFSPDKITVKKDDIVKIHATSRDVTHGFSIKEYNISTSIKKGEPKEIEFLANKTGEFDIICSVYCGKGHRDMKAKLIVEE